MANKERDILIKVKTEKKSMSNTTSSLANLTTKFLGITAIITLTTKLFKNLYGIISGFSSAVSDLASIMGTTTEGISDLTDMAMELGISTKYTTTQVIGLAKSLAKLGFSKDEIIQMSSSVLDLASALDVELDAAATLAGSTMRGFGIDASDAQHTMEVLGVATTSSALDFEKLSVALPYVQTAARGMNFSLEETTSMLAQLTDRGLQASTAGTSLRKIFAELTKKGLTMDEALQMINDSTDRNKTSMELFGLKAKDAGIILADTVKPTAELTTKLNEADGALKNMSDTKLDNIEGDVTKLGSAWDGLVLTIAESQDKSGSFFRTVIKGITKATRLASFYSLSNVELATHLDEFNEKAKKGDLSDIQLKEKKISLNKELIKLTDEKGNVVGAKDNETAKILVKNINKIKALELNRAEAKIAAIKKEGDDIIAGAQWESKVKREAAEEEAKEEEKRSEERNARNAVNAAKEKKDAEELAEAKALAEERIVQLKNSAELKKIENSQAYYDELARQTEIQYQKEALAITNSIVDKDLQLLALDELELINEENRRTQKENNDEWTKEQEAKTAEDLKLIADKKAEDEDTARLKKLAAEKEVSEQLIKLATTALNDLSKLNEAYAKNQLSRSTTLYNDEEKALQAKLDNGEISQEEYDEFLKKADRDRVTRENDINRKAFENQKVMDLLSIAINTTVGISKALATLGPVAGAIAAVGVGVSGAIGAGIVLSKQFQPQPLPTAETGGLIGGNRHSNGGTMINAEVGEFISNRGASQRYMPLLSKINDSANSTTQQGDEGDLINYDKLASVLNAQEVIIVDSKINDSQVEVQIKDSISSF